MRVIFDRVRARYGFPIDHERFMGHSANLDAAQPPRQSSLFS
jgi:hypothetical protein